MALVLDGHCQCLLLFVTKFGVFVELTGNRVIMETSEWYELSWPVEWFWVLEILSCIVFVVSIFQGTWQR